MKPIFSPTDFVKATVIKHPSLYASANFETTQFKVFDHVFNTIGNGIRGQRGFNEKLAILRGVDDWKLLSISYDWKAATHSKLECVCRNRFKRFIDEEKRDLFLK
jgi:hypothetical protein